MKHIRLLFVSSINYFRLSSARVCLIQIVKKTYNIFTFCVHFNCQLHYLRKRSLFTFNITQCRQQSSAVTKVNWILRAGSSPSEDAHPGFTGSAALGAHLLHVLELGRRSYGGRQFWSSWRQPTESPLTRHSGGALKLVRPLYGPGRPGRARRPNGSDPGRRVGTAGRPRSRGRHPGHRGAMEVMGCRTDADAIAR